MEQYVDLLAFPECCITGYWHLRKLSRPDLVALAEPVYDGSPSQRLSALSQQTGITIGAGLVEIDADGALYNTYVVTCPTASSSATASCTVVSTSTR